MRVVGTAQCDEKDVQISNGAPHFGSMEAQCDPGEVRLAAKVPPLVGRGHPHPLKRPGMPGHGGVAGKLDLVVSEDDGVEGGRLDPPLHYA